MCGILGCISSQPLKPYESNIRKLFIESEKRGTDAMGMFLFNHDRSPIAEVGETKWKQQLFKEDTHPARFYGVQKGSIVLDSIQVLLAHTRQGTGGSAADNKNNHPFESDHFVWAHNGVIGKDKELKKEFDLKYDSECDSYVIGALAQMYYNETKDVKQSVLKAASLLAERSAGNFAVWMVHKESQRIFFFRNSNPFEYAFLTDGTFVFASTSHFLKDAFKDCKEFKAKDTSTLVMDRLYELVPEGKSFKLEVVAELPKAGTGMYMKKGTPGNGQGSLYGPPGGHASQGSWVKPSGNSPPATGSKKSVPKALAERAIALSDALNLDGWFCRRRNEHWLFITGQEKLVDALKKSSQYKDRVRDMEQKAASPSMVVMLDLEEGEVEKFLDELERTFRSELVQKEADSLLRYFEGLEGVRFARDTGLKIYFTVDNGNPATIEVLNSIGFTQNKEGEFSVKKGRGGKSHHNILSKMQQKIRLLKKEA